MADKVKFMDAEVVIAVEPFWVDIDGEAVFVAQGTRYRGADPEVRRAPKLFAPADSTTAELVAQRAALLDPMIAKGVEADQRARAEEAKRHPTIAPEDELEVRVGFTTGRGGPSYGAGARVSRKDPAIARLLKSNPELFQIPARAVVS
jgi:hypothetical protein